MIVRNPKTLKPLNSTTSDLRSPAEWRQRAASAAAARDQFSNLFGDGASGKEGGDAAAAKHAAPGGDGAAEEDGARDAEGSGAQPAAKKAKRAVGAAAGEDATIGGALPSEPDAGGATAAKGKKKKKRKGAEVAEAKDSEADVARARAAALGGQRTADVMQLLGEPGLGHWR